jgi:exosortase/archaeosortase family protein
MHRFLDPRPTTSVLKRIVRSYGYPAIIGFGIASAQITLLFRSDLIPDAIASSLVWMAALVLLNEVQVEETSVLPLPTSEWLRWLPIWALGWCLLVLTFTARFYDPLLLVVPLMCCMALLLLLDRAVNRRRNFRDLMLICLMLPLQRVLVAILPIEMIVTATSRLACVGLWGFGQECFSFGKVIQIGSRQIVVDPPCAGVATLALALTSSLVFLVLFPIRRRWFVVVSMLAASLLIAFLFNTFRVIVLSLSSKQCDVHWWTSYCGFEFWHTGPGSHLFVLAAVGGVCWLWWWNINHHDTAPSC